MLYCIVWACYRNVFSRFQWTIYRMASAVALDSATNERRLEEIRNIADTTQTDGICFAHGEFFTFAETSKVKLFSDLSNTGSQFKEYSHQ